MDEGAALICLWNGGDIGKVLLTMTGNVLGLGKLTCLLKEFIKGLFKLKIGNAGEFPFCFNSR